VTVTPTATTTAPPRERAQTAKVAAYDHVRRQILRDATDEPYFLLEETVASELGVSRTPVREAFLMLEAEGLLQLVPRKGAVVAPITGRQVREVMEVRSVVESWAASHVVADAQLRPALLASLRVHQTELERIGDDDPTALIEADRQFHRELVAAAGNQVMLDLYERMRDLQLRMGVRAVIGDPGRAAAVRREHERIVDALEAGVEADVLEAVRAHLDVTLASLSDRAGAA
jgi:DNA-binding GntR family transcriptional regulator